MGKRVTVAMAGAWVLPFVVPFVVAPEIVRFVEPSGNRPYTWPAFNSGNSTRSINMPDSFSRNTVSPAEVSLKLVLRPVARSLHNKTKKPFAGMVVPLGILYLVDTLS
jgi:hypothetical protein